MAFASTVSGARTAGGMRCKFGTFSNGDGDSGGSITTGLHYIASHNVTVSSDTDAAIPKTTTSGGTLTLVTGNNIDGTWEATGR